jgi:hypothetical protein
MLKKIFLFLLLLILPKINYAQQINEFGGRVGFYLNEFNIHNTAGFSTESNGDLVALFIHLYGRSYLANSKRLSVFYGAGVSRDLLYFTPNISFQEINELKDLKSKDLWVSEVYSWSYKLNIPIGISYQLTRQINLLPPLIVIPGIRINAGLENYFTVKRIRTDNLVLEDYDDQKKMGYYYFDTEVNNRVSEFYKRGLRSTMVVPYLGLEFVQNGRQITYSAGFNVSSVFNSPISARTYNKIYTMAYVSLSHNVNWDLSKNRKDKNIPVKQSEPFYF